jgi:hypothetical protein
LITLPAIIEGVSTRKDKTVRVTIGTQEMTPATAAQLFSMANQYAYVAIKVEEFLGEDMAALDDLSTEGEPNRTPSKRLRSVLYVNWKQDPEGYEDFRNYYLYKMERIIEHFKGRLDE